MDPNPVYGSPTGWPTHALTSPDSPYPPTSIVLALTAGGSTPSSITGTGATPAARLCHGLCATLLAIALLGQKFIGNARWAADPHSWFRRGLGIVFILVGIIIILGWDKDIQTWILETSPIAPWELDSGFIPDQ